MFKLARTYDELNKYKKKKILCHRNFICSNFYSAHAITCANSLLPFLLPSSLFPSSLARSHLVDYYFLPFVIFLLIKNWASINDIPRYTA